LRASTAAGSWWWGRTAPAPCQGQPASAAAEACRTITDSYVECGLLTAESFLGGTQKIDPGAAHRAIETDLANPLRMSCAEVALFSQ
jgi:N-methylhydantoinase A/oxoprolinase/acetone carboxylase beta subunit